MFVLGFTIQTSKILSIIFEGLLYTKCLSTVFSFNSKCLQAFTMIMLNFIDEAKLNLSKKSFPI